MPHQHQTRKQGLLVQGCFYILTRTGFVIVAAAVAWLLIKHWS